MTLPSMASENARTSLLGGVADVKGLGDPSQAEDNPTRTVVNYLCRTPNESSGTVKPVAGLTYRPSVDNVKSD